MKVVQNEYRAIADRGVRRGGKKGAFYSQSALEASHKQMETQLNDLTKQLAEGGDKMK